MSDSVLMVLIWCGTILAVVGGFGYIIYAVQAEKWNLEKAKNRVAADNYLIIAHNEREQLRLKGKADEQSPH